LLAAQPCAGTAPGWSRCPTTKAKQATGSPTPPLIRTMKARPKHDEDMVVHTATLAEPIAARSLQRQKSPPSAKKRGSKKRT